MNANSSLLVKKETRQRYTVALIIALLVGIASFAGLVFTRALYPTAALRESFLANDFVILFIGTPILLLSIWLSKHEKLIGFLFLPGAFFFTFYNYLTYLLAMPHNWFYVVYPAIVILSLYGLLTFLPKLDGQAIKDQLTGRVKERFGGGVLTILGLIFFARAVSILFNAAIGQAAIPRTELALNISDFIVSPVWMLCGVSLWQRKPFGYLTGLGMLFQGSMLFLGLIILMLIQPLVTGTKFPTTDIIVIFVVGMICFVPFWLFLRGIQKSG